MRRLRLLFVALLAGAGCYSTSDLENGKLHCSASGQCPTSFSCVDDICWRGGIVVGQDLSAGADDLSPGGGGGGGSGGDGGTGGGGGGGFSEPIDLAGADLGCSSDSMCPDGYYCKIAASMCVPQLSTDSACTADDQCLSSSCNLTKCTWVALNWVQIPAFSDSQYSNNAVAMPFPDGRVVAFAGDGGGLGVSAFNVTTRAVQTLASMPVARQNAGAALDPAGNRIWIFGGQTGAVTANYLSFDLTSWTPVGTYAAMPEPLFWHACATLASNIYCGGGTTTGANSGNPVTFFESFTPNQVGPFNTLASIPYASTIDIAMAGFNGAVWVAGGSDGNSNNTASVASFAGGAWTTRASLNQARETAGLAGGPDGRLYVVGGDNNDDSTSRPLASVEAYSPALNRWVTLPTTLSTPRTDFALVAGADGRLYAVGGLGGAAGATRVGVTEAYGPDVKLAATTAAAGSTLSVSGNNFAVSARVEVLFDGVAIAHSTTDGFGGLAAVSFTVPNVPAGAHRVVVVDNRSGYPITLYLTTT